MVIVSKTDNIPTKEIVSVLGTITIRSSEMWSFSNWNEAKAMDKIIDKAKRMGANAVINFTYNKNGTHISCTGLGVVVEDFNSRFLDREKNKEIKLCEKCGNQMQKEFKFCPFCGAE